jgi:hypothetical protein
VDWAEGIGWVFSASRAENKVSARLARSDGVTKVCCVAVGFDIGCAIGFKFDGIACRLPVILLYSRIYRPFLYVWYSFDKWTYFASYIV